MNTVSKQVVSLQDARIARGQQAWKKIKATAQEQRELWKEIGEALLVGRRLHKADQKFSQWCKDYGFGDMDNSVRSNALWWVSVCNDCKPPVDLTHPTNLRQWHRENQKTRNEPELPEDLKDLAIEPVAPSVTLDTRSAEKTAKVIQRSKGTDEGAVIAKRHVESIAKKHGVTAEMLEEAVASKAPMAYHNFSVPQTKALNDFREGILSDAQAMQEEGISKEAIRHIFISIANQL